MGKYLNSLNLNFPPKNQNLLKVTRADPEEAAGPRPAGRPRDQGAEGPGGEEGEEGREKEAGERGHGHIRV